MAVPFLVECLLVPLRGIARACFIALAMILFPPLIEIIIIVNTRLRIVHVRDNTKYTFRFIFQEASLFTDAIF